MVFERYIKNYIKEFNDLDREVWNYEDGCILIGAEKLFHATGESFYYDCIRNYVDRYVDEDGNIKGYEREEYNIDRIPSGLVLFLLYEKSGEIKYRKAIEALRLQLKHHPRTKSGSFWHKKIYPNQIWLDGLYMGMPYYLTYEKMFGTRAAYDDVMMQFNNARNTLFDEGKKLYYHGWDEAKEIFWADKETGLSKNFWSRALGWYLMALIDCYEILPEEETKHRNRLGELLKEAVDGLLLYQDKESGLFYQLTALKDVKGNYLETSSSIMFAYGILKGVRLGVLEEAKYRGIGEEILIGVETRMFQQYEGKIQLTGICKGAGLGPENNLFRDGSVEYYLKEEVVADEQKGVGVMMMAFGEWLQLLKYKPVEPTNYPRVEIWNGKY